MPGHATSPPDSTVEAEEIAKFSALAETWWDPNGPMRPLHALNPARLRYIRRCLERHYGLNQTSLTPFTGLRVADVGCGAGLLCEPMARLGATVTGIDASQETIRIAAAHAETQGLAIDYRCATAATLVAEDAEFDCVMTLEVIEHVADLPAFINACVQMTAPGGALLLSTLNRTAKSFALAIVGAEYVLRWLPRGTHRWDKFVKPTELRRHLKASGAELRDVAGLSMDLRSGDWRLGPDRAVNYLGYATKAAGKKARA